MDFDCTSALLLENTRVRLEALIEQHIELLLPIAMKHPTVLRYSPSPFGSAENLKAYFSVAFEAKKAGSRYPFAIFDKKENRYVGSSNFGTISNTHKHIEIGWTWIDKAVQRTGLNRNCKFLLLQHAFETLKFERVELKTDSQNVQSRTAILGIGATYEGTLRSHTLMLDGYRRNTVYFSILKAEWPSVKERVFKAFI